MRSALLSETRATLALAVPLAAANLSQIAMSVIDTVMVGSLGATPLAAVALGGGFYFAAVVICQGVLNAVAPLAAYHVGAGERAARLQPGGRDRHLDIEQHLGQRLALRVVPERGGAAAVQRLVQDEVEAAEAGPGKALDRSADEMGEMGLHGLRRHGLGDEVPGARSDDVDAEDAVRGGVSQRLDAPLRVAEGAGAAGLAAILAFPERFAGKAVGTAVCGGNIDSRILANVLLRNLLRDGRILRLHLDIPDRPGVLADIATRVAAAGGNVIEVLHQRLFAAPSVQSAELELMVEVRDASQGEALVAALVAGGYSVRRG